MDLREESFSKNLKYVNFKTWYIHKDKEQKCSSNNWLMIDCKRGYVFGVNVQGSKDQ